MTSSTRNSLQIRGMMFDSSWIVSGDLALSHSMMGETLAADDLTVVINAGIRSDAGFYEGYIPLGDTEPYETADEGVYFILSFPALPLFNKHGQQLFNHSREPLYTRFDPWGITDITTGDEVFYYADNTLVGKYFLQKLTRIGRNRYKLEATSAVGLLIQSDHYGGVYSDVKAQAIFADILGDIPYTLSTALKNAVIYGYLPIASRRDNLQQLLFATGGALFTDSTGKLNITTMQDAIAGNFDASRCYTGGSVEVSDAVPAVDVTEHNYFSTAEIEPETLLEEGVDGSVTVRFNGPHYDLQCTGGTITESSANHAVIQAQGFVTLTGKPYTHITHIVRAGDSAAVNNVKSVTNATLANPQIAQALAKRLYQFLQCTTRIRQDVLFGTERAGQMVQVVNPYTMETETAAVTEFDVAMSGVNKASGSFLVGFEPQGVLSGYQHYIVLTGNDSWIVPPEAKTGTARLILIGAGSGGAGGFAGKNGKKFKDGSNDYTSIATTDAETRAGGEAGAGGKAGSGGAGGKIFKFTLTVTPGQVFSYSCGIGGDGGAGGEPEVTEVITTTSTHANPENPSETITEHITTENVTPEIEPGEGAVGTAAAFGGRSSDWGKEYPAGYYEPKTGEWYAVSGSAGYDGSAGGHGARYPVSSDNPVLPGEDGESCEGFSGGTGGGSEWAYTTEADPQTLVQDYIHQRAGGGGGGGAAYKTRGNNGADGDCGIDTSEPYTWRGDPYGGAGGEGATPEPGASAVTYGCGGDGGHGGGGGGGGGASLRGAPGETSKGIAYAGTPGAGGDGSAGGNGANGVIIIYY